MNKVILIGRLTRDPEYSATEDWTPVCTFTLAVPRAYKDAAGKHPTDFFRVVAWRDLADTVQKYSHRGDRVAVYGMGYLVEAKGVSIRFESGRWIQTGNVYLPEEVDAAMEEYKKRFLTAREEAEKK